MSVFHNNVLSGAAGQGGAAAVEGPTKSLRFNSGDSSSLTRTPSSAGNRKTFTFSCWVKRSKLGGSEGIFDCRPASGSGMTDSNLTVLYFDTDNELKLSGAVTEWRSTSQVFRDVSSFYHIVLAVDTTSATAADRIKLYVNGSQVTDFGSNNNPSQNHEFAWNLASKHAIGSNTLSTPTGHINAYLADIYFVDGSQLEPTSFGAYDDNGVWQAAAYSGTFGTNGFHLLDFANESTVGHDSSGNNNDFTANNITNVEANNTDGIDNVSNITQVQNNGTNVTVNLTNLRTMMNASTFQDADTDNSSYGVRVAGTSKKFGVKWSNLTGLTGVSVRWQRASTYDVDVKTTGTGITTTTTTGISGRQQNTFSTTSTTGQIVFEDVTSGNTNGFFIRAIEFKGYGSVTYPTNAENFAFPNEDQDVLFDVPTNHTQSDTGAGGEVSGNYCTWNPLAKDGGTTYSNGNLEISSTNHGNNAATFFLTSGKWYWEGKGAGYVGAICSKAGQNATASISAPGSGAIGYWQDGPVYWDGNYNNSGTTSYGTSDIIGTALDMDNGIVYFYKNGSLTYTITFGDGTIPDLSDGVFPCYNNGNPSGTKTATYNFGQRPFAYTAPSGYKALCTTNLPDPTIADGSAYFNTALWTGDGGSSVSVTTGFEPDFIWIKQRNKTYYHQLYDAVRGYGVGKALASNENTAEGYGGSNQYGYVSSTNSTGFTGTAGSGTPLYVNENNTTYVAWTWDGGDLATNSAYNQSAVWSNDLTATSSGAYFATGAGAADAFDGDLNNSAQSEPNGSTITFSPTGGITVSTSLRVYRGSDSTSNTVNVAVNGGSAVTFARGSWVDLSFTGTLTSLAVSSPSANPGLSAVEVDGKVLVDAGVIPAGSLNSTRYNQDQNWGPGSTITGNWAFSDSVDNAFDGDLTTVSRAAASQATTINLPADVAFTSSVKLTGSVDVAGGQIYVKDGTDAFVNVSSGFNTSSTVNTVDITSLLTSPIKEIKLDSVGNGYCRMSGIEVDGKILASSSVTPPSFPSIASTVRANQTAGISIVTYTNPSSGTFTVGHGLNADVGMIITKHRNRAADWYVWHSAFTSEDDYINLNTTSEKGTATDFWGASPPGSSTFGGKIGTSALAGDTDLAIVFSAVAGYSAFGSYEGGGSSATAPFVYTGFKPAWLMVKNATASGGNWMIYDNARVPYNLNNAKLAANLTGQENESSTMGGTSLGMDFLSNGFKYTGDGGGNHNSSGETYIFAAFAENPFQANGGLAR